MSEETKSQNIWPLGKKRRAPCPLTMRQQGILQMKADGLTSKEIAARLCITEQTVKTHIMNCLFTLKAQNTMSAVVKGIKEQWIVI